MALPPDIFFDKIGKVVGHLVDLLVDEPAFTEEHYYSITKVLGDVVYRYFEILEKEGIK